MDSNPATRGHKRFIDPEFFRHEGLSELPVETTLLFIGLWTLSDRRGVLLDRPKVIRAELFMLRDEYDTEAVIGMLDALEAGGFIRRYRVGEKRMIWIPGFGRWQRPHYREKPNDLPGPEHDPKLVQQWPNVDATSDQGPGDVEPTTQRRRSRKTGDPPEAPPVADSATSIQQRPNVDSTLRQRRPNQPVSATATVTDTDSEASPPRPLIPKPVAAAAGEKSAQALAAAAAAAAGVRFRPLTGSVLATVAAACAAEEVDPEECEALIQFADGHPHWGRWATIPLALSRRLGELVHDFEQWRAGEAAAAEALRKAEEAQS